MATKQYDGEPSQGPREGSPVRKFNKKKFKKLENMRASVSSEDAVSDPSLTPATVKNVLELIDDIEEDDWSSQEGSRQGQPVDPPEEQFSYLRCSTASSSQY